MSVQDAQWGGWAHDQQHDGYAWMGIIYRHMQRAYDALMDGGDAEYRERMLAVTAVGVAALEAFAKHGGKAR